jgi:hypothetical protein
VCAEGREFDYFGFCRVSLGTEVALRRREA